ACALDPRVNEALSLSSSPVSGVSLFLVLNLPLSLLSALKRALPTRPQSPPPALHPHSSHLPLFRSPRYPLNSFFGSPALHFHPDIVSAVSVSSELFVPLCHSFALSTSLARNDSSPFDSGTSLATFPLIEWSLASSSPRGIFESSITLSSLCGPDTSLLFLILSLASKFPASL